MRLARCDLCFVSPERCHYHVGTCREPEWAEGVCWQPHTVYLALSSGPKVGITRAGREWRRWVDQGAVIARPLARVASRRLAGLLESFLKRWVADATDWRRLVRGERKLVSLEELSRQLSVQAQQFVAERARPEETLSIE